jgi:hypothetical protein
MRQLNTQEILVVTGAGKPACLGTKPVEPAAPKLPKIHGHKHGRCGQPPVAIVDPAPVDPVVPDDSGTDVPADDTAAQD